MLWRSRCRLFGRQYKAFWESSASAWFAQTEAQFALREITADTTRYYYVVSVLGNSTASRVVSLLKNPLAREKYTALNAHLLKKFEISDAERASRLFSLQGLSDSKPSELMDRMLDLMGEHEPDFLFVQLFLRQLPSQVRAALANTMITDSRRLAEEADTFSWRVKGTPPHIAPVTLDDSTLIAATTSRRQQSSDPQQSSGPQRSSGMCFYHAKFGPKALKCLPPCSYGGLGNARAGAR